MDGGTGQNIMELIDEDSMPQLVDFCLWVCDLGLCQQAEQFQVLRLERLLRAMEVYVPR